MPKRWPSLPPAIFDIFRGVELLLHAGDVGKLWVLDELSAIAPVLAVHGNDETDEAQRELPYQLIVALGGRRLLLCHSHLPDRAAEMASRVDDAWAPKLARRAAQARQAGASLYVLGHLHVPFVVEYDGVWLVNPGAIASGSAFTRQTRPTVALLYMRDDGRPFVVHVDLAQPQQSYRADVAWAAGFTAAGERYSASIAGPGVPALAEAIRTSRFSNDRRLWLALARAGMPCWLGHKALMTLDDVATALTEDDTFSAEERAELWRLVERAAAG